MDLKRLLNKLCNYFFHVLQFVLVDTTNESFISLQGVYHCQCSFAILLEIPLSLESFEKNRKMPCPNTFLLSCLAAGDLLFVIIAETNMFFLITGSKVRLQANSKAVLLQGESHEISRAKTHFGIFCNGLRASLVCICF